MQKLMGANDWVAGYDNNDDNYVEIIEHFPLSPVDKPIIIRLLSEPPLRPPSLQSEINPKPNPLSVYYLIINNIIRIFRHPGGNMLCKWL